MIDDREDRSLVLSGRQLMVQYADACKSIEDYNGAVIRHWMSDECDPKKLHAVIDSFQRGSELEPLLHTPAGESSLKSAEATDAQGFAPSTASASTGNKTQRDYDFGNSTSSAAPTQLRIEASSKIATVMKTTDYSIKHSNNYRCFDFDVILLLKG
jgi:hypothetical protein